MAKQDLVVKLLLDSGAFGNDLRQAERKAQEFSNNMKDAGKTASEFADEIGLSTGAVGSLGKMLTGAGAVVAAVGAFKSIMESSYETASEFHGVIGGFQGVLSEFQEAIATFDFSNFNNGLRAVFGNAKEAKQALMDAEVSDVAYDYLSSQYKQQLKALEVESKDPATTPERRAEISGTLTNSILSQWSDTARGNANSQFDAFISKMRSEQELLSREYLTIDKAKELMDVTMTNITTNRDQIEADKKEWKRVNKQLTKLANQRKITQFGANQARNSGFTETADSMQAQADDYQRQHDELAMQYQDLMFRIEAYKMGVDELKNQQNILTRAYDVEREVDEYKNQVDGWVKSMNTPPKKKEKEPEPDSIKYLQDQISKDERDRELYAVNSAEWNKKTAAIVKNRLALAELIKKQNEYEEVLRATARASREGNDDVVNVNSIGYIQGEIAHLESVKDTQSVGSAEWMETIEAIDAYKIELKELMEVQDALMKQYDDTQIPPPEVVNVESIKYIQEMISFYEELRDTMTVGSAEWVDASDALDSFRVELEELLKVQESYDGQYNPAEKQNEWNDALESSVFLFNSLSDAMAQAKDESVRDGAAIMSIMGAIAEGALNVIPALQALTAAEGTASAAAAPWPANIAAIMSIIATVTSVYASIKQMGKAGKYAEGGIVGGTSYSGDKLFAMVNSGEMILNKRQQSNLSNMLGSGRDNSGGGQVEFHISGDTLVGVLNNKRNKTHLIR